MREEVLRAVEILVRDGPSALLDSSSKYLFHNTSLGDRLRFTVSRRQLRRRMNEEADLDDVMDTVLLRKPGVPPYRVWAMQIREELRALTERVAETEPATAIEIGTANGGTLYT